MSYDPGISGISGAADVFLNNPANNDALSYNTVAGKWENATVDKTRVGLANVDNTSDVSKPVSTAQQTALNAKINASAINTASGVAGLDSGSKLSTTQMPDSVQAIIIESSGSYALRSTVTSSAMRPVIWRGADAPTIGSGYAINDMDTWEPTA